VEQFLTETAFLGNRVFWDLHVGAEPASVAAWEQMVESFQTLVDASGSLMRFMILEENGSDHGLLRGMGHATYSNMMHRHGDFAQAHGYANCLEAYQGMDFEQMFPQGQVFFLPNMTWGQPTYYVVKMVQESYQPHNIPVSIGSLQNVDGNLLMLVVVGVVVSYASIAGCLVVIGSRCHGKHGRFDCGCARC
jgi:hypothetical protein